MSDINTTPEILTIDDMENKRLPTALNVLTILTIIASIYGILSGISSYFSICKSLEKMEDLDMQKIGGAFGKFMEWSMTNLKEMTPKLCENKMAILIITIVTCSLCLVGAFQMRKRLKMGFVFYAVGELLYPISFIALGISWDTTIIASYFFVPVVFLLLYLFQRKHLTN